MDGLSIQHRAEGEHGVALRAGAWPEGSTRRCGQGTRGRAGEGTGSVTVPRGVLFLKARRGRATAEMETGEKGRGV